MKNTRILEQIKGRESFNRRNPLYDYRDLDNIIKLFQDCISQETFLRALYQEVVEGMFEFRKLYFKTTEVRLVSTYKRWNQALKHPCKFFDFEKYFEFEEFQDWRTGVTLGFVKSSDYHKIHLNLSPELFDGWTEDEVFSHIEATFLHELTHVFQLTFQHVRKMDSFEVPYLKRWHEEEARFVAEYVTKNRLFQNRCRGEFFV